MILARLYRLDLPSGVLRMSSLPADWTDPEGAVWIGGAGIVTEEGGGAGEGLDGGVLTLTWNGASAALIAAARSADFLGARMAVASAWIDDGVTPAARVGAPFDEWAGLCDTPEIPNDPARPVISVSAQSPLLLLGKAEPIYLDDETQRALDPDDTGGSFIALIDGRPLNIKAP